MTELPRSASGKPAVEVARECARAAGGIIRGGFGHPRVAAAKGRGNVLTETDLAAEAAVMTILREEFPGHAVMSEESASETRSAGWMWVVDPLDGTKNFSRGIPHFAFSIALCEENEPVLGLTYQPLLDEEYLGGPGLGCSLNGRECGVTDVASVFEGVIALDMGYDDARAARQLELARQLWPVQGLRVTGSAALGFAWAACGRWDVYCHLDLQPWDIAAGIALVRAAGGVVTDRDGERATIYSRSAVAGGPAVHAAFMSLAAEMPWRA